MCLAAVQNLLDRDVIQDSYQPANMILVRVSCDQEIQACDSMAAQIGLDSRPGVLCATVDEDVLSGELE